MQRELRVHSDGSVFSINILLNPTSEFQGGGTIFEKAGQVSVTPAADGAVL